MGNSGCCGKQEQIFLPAGQVSFLQSSRSEETPSHGVPPFASRAMTLLVLDRVPPPHDLLQLLHGSYPPHVQLTRCKKKLQIIPGSTYIVYVQKYKPINWE